MYVLVRAWGLRVYLMSSMKSIFWGMERWKPIGAKAGQGNLTRLNYKERLPVIYGASTGRVWANVRTSIKYCKSQPRSIAEGMLLPG